VMATQNPIEQEGTYPLPGAQLDRFLMYVQIDYPDPRAERAILNLARQEAKQGTWQQPARGPVVKQGAIHGARQEILNIHMSEAIEEYIVQLVIATRDPKAYGKDMVNWLRYGASPRGTIGLDRCARAHAWLRGRDYVSPEDIHAIAHDVLRHRTLLSFEAEAEGISTDRFISEILNRVAIP